MNILPLILVAFEDRAWKVRMVLAEIFQEFIEFFEKEIIETVLIPLYMKLLDDHEGEVVIEALKGLNNFQRIISKDHIDQIFKNLAEGLENSLENIQIEIISTLSQTQLLQRLEFEQIRQTDFLKKIENYCLNKKGKLKSTAIIAYSKMIKHYGFEKVENTENVFSQILKDLKWRVRALAYENLFELASLPKNQEHFHTKIHPLIVNIMKDNASEIRDLANTQYPNMISIYKIDWFMEKVYPSIIEIIFSK